MSEDPKAISRRAVFEGLARRSSSFVRRVLEDEPTILASLPDSLLKAVRVLDHHRARLHWGAPEAALGARREDLDEAVRELLATAPDEPTVRRLRDLYVSLPWFRPVAEVDVLRAGRSLRDITENVAVADGVVSERAGAMKERILSEVASRTAEIDALLEGIG